MFGYREDYRLEQEKIQKNADRYFTKTYLDVEDFKKYIQNADSFDNIIKLFAYTFSNIYTLFYSRLCYRRK